MKRGTIKIPKKLFDELKVLGKKDNRSAAEEISYLLNYYYENETEEEHCNRDPSYAILSAIKEIEEGDCLTFNNWEEAEEFLLNYEGSLEDAQEFLKNHEGNREEFKAFLENHKGNREDTRKFSENHKDNPEDAQEFSENTEDKRMTYRTVRIPRESFNRLKSLEKSASPAYTLSKQINWLLNNFYDKENKKKIIQQTIIR